MIAMAANENNEKYMAEAWIDDGKEEDFKKSFLQNLLCQWQGHKTDDDEEDSNECGKGFNADKVDGKHYNDIHEEIVDATSNCLSEIIIGNLVFTRENNNSLLPFDLIHLKVENHDNYYDNVDYDAEKMALPWATTEDLGRSPNLNEVFSQVYDMIQDRCTLEEINQIRTDLLDPLTQLKDSLENSGALDSEGNINAASVNGIRFYIVSERQYARIREEHPEAIANIKNVFIVKPNSEIDAMVDDDGQLLYPEGCVDDEASLAPISSYYKFRIAQYTPGVDLDVIDDPELTTAGRYLQYKHENANKWRNMCLVNDLLDMENMKDRIINVLESTDYTIRSETFYNALSTLDDSTSLLKDRYISGAYYNTVEDGQRHDITPVMDSLTEYRYLDLTALYDNLRGQIQNVISNLNTLTDNTMGDASTSLKSRIDAIESSIKSITGNNSFSPAASIKTLKENLDTLKTRVTTLEGKTGDTGWKNLTPIKNNNFIVYPGSVLQVRKVGKIVQIRGAVQTTKEMSSSQDERQIATVGTEFRPSAQVTAINNGSGYARHLFSVHSDGKVTTERNEKGGTYSKYPKGGWLRCDIVYMV